MWNDHLGKVADKRNLCALSLEHAQNLVRLIVRNSYVRFGQQVYHQTTGISMGINPGVYLANFYLYASEFQFLRQFYDLLHQYPPTQDEDRIFLDPAALQFIACEDAPFVLQHATAEQIGEAVLHVLSNFRFMARFVDDLITGPNRFIRQLVHVGDTLLGGLIKGIYPAYLNLKESPPAEAAVPPHAPCRTNALDI